MEGTIETIQDIIDSNIDVESSSDSDYLASGEDVLKEIDESNDIKDNNDSFHRYEKEWLQLCRDAVDIDDLGELRRRALIGSLRASRFRSLSWRLLLRLLPPEPDAWPTVLNDQREHYFRLNEMYDINPTVLYDQDDPLSQDTKSCWNQYFCNKELRDVIRQDVIRTFPGIDFFRESAIQEKMVSILFCYARANPDMCYRQGMHEVLAPLLFVLRSDHEALMHIREQAPVSREIIKVLDPQHLEADAYTLFCRVMSGLECSYRIPDISPSNTGQLPFELENFESKKTETELMSQLLYIRNNLLVPNDADLAEHLKKLDIPLTLFGIRWLRLLFGREFPLQDLLVLWDAIFAETDGGGNCFELVNYIVVAMLIAIRHQLISGDYVTCLSHLMRYPGAVDVTHIISHALYLKDPEKHCQPAVVSFPNLPVITIGGRPDMNRGPVDPTKMTNKNPKDKNRPVLVNKEKINKSEITKNSSSLSKKFSKMSTGWSKKPIQQNQEKKDEFVNKGQSIPSLSIIANAETDDVVVEGYSLDDPLAYQLQRAYAIIRKSHFELGEHLSVLESRLLSSDTDPTISRAIDGIKLVCIQLNNFQCPPVQIEPATEAGEIPKSKFVRTMKSSVTLPVAVQPHKKIVEMKLMNQIQGPNNTIEGAPQENPLKMYK